jgi:DNA-binding transcriptional ArsR family regulator
MGINKVPDKNELCSECFRVVGSESRYKIVCLLGVSDVGMTVSDLTKKLKLQQPTVTHHLNALRSINAVWSDSRGRERFYYLKKDAHCFEECNIPFD